ncbi:MAG: polysaccharide pyruvyl transferase family protein [Proteobacteria bacterium]|nr:polysaccharide pyruvyl transferase family protein [Pseudomonadota bacterium]
MKIGSFVSVVLLAASCIGGDAFSSARGGAEELAYADFDYKSYARHTGQSERAFSKKQFWTQFKSDTNLHTAPNMWFHPDQFQEFFPLEGNPTPYQVYVNFYAQGDGVRPLQHGETQEIISMTTHGDRINTAWLALESALRQEIKAHQVILWLYEGDYKKLFHDRRHVFESEYLHPSLKALGRRGLSIRFSSTNYKVATKLLPCYGTFPNAFITTIDDDRIYSPMMTRAYQEQYAQHPGCIVSAHVRSYVTYPHGGGINYLAQDVVYPEGSEPQPGPYGPCQPHYGPPIFGIFEGFSGVQYFPGALGERVIKDFNPLFNLLTPCADDIWYQAHAIRTGTKCVGLPQEIGDAIFNPREIDGTQESGLFRRHLDANSYMADKAFWYYGLFEKLGIPFNPLILCDACRRPVPMVGPHETFPAPKTHKGTECHMCLNNDQKTVLVLGAGGYGNIGDELYPAVLKHYLKSNFEVFYAPDTVRVSTDGLFMELNDKRADLAFDALVVGGGGILKNLGRSALRYHIERALQMRKPVVFTSVGVQTTLKNPTPSDVRALLGGGSAGSVTLSPVRIVTTSSSSSMAAELSFAHPASSIPEGELTTLDFLEQASLIFARTPMDARLLQGALAPEAAARVRYYPDLGYLAPSVLSIEPERRRKYVTLIPTGSVHTGQELVRARIKALLAEHDAKLLVMNWGGPKDPALLNFDPDRDLVALAKEHFPRAKVYYGDSISSLLKELRYRHKKVIESDLTPKKALEKIAKSYHVITGRLHGTIIASAMGVPYTVMDFSHKLTAQQNVSPDVEHAMMSLTHLAHYLERGGPALRPAPLWDDPHRNHMILRVAGLSGLPIPVIQEYDNAAIYDYLAFGIRPSQDPHMQARLGAHIPIPPHPDTWDEDMRNAMIVEVDAAQKHSAHEIARIQSLSNEALFHVMTLKDGHGGDLSGPLTHFFDHKGTSLKDPSTWKDGDRDARINSAHEKDTRLPIDFIQAMDNVTIYKFLAFGIHPLGA